MKRSVSIKGHQTSYTLEPEFHAELIRLGKQNAIPLSRLIARIDASRDEATNLSSALRLYVLRELKKNQSEISPHP